MIISHSKQVCFWKISRTGSTTIEVVLRLTAGLDFAQDVIAETDFYLASANYSTMPNGVNGAPGPRRAHVTPQTAIDNGILTQGQYDTYDHYCIVRDPIDRFISSYQLALPRYEFDVARIFEENVKPMDVAIWRAQSEYLTLGNITTLPFSDFTNSAHTIFTAFGAPIPVHLPNISKAHLRYEATIKQQTTPEQRTLIKAHYAADTLLNF